MTIEYIAGFFDGEGTINIVKNKIRISIPQTNLEVLENIKEFLTFGSIFKEKKRKEHWKDSWVLYTGNSNDTFQFLNMVYPYLIVKKEKAKEAISTYTKFLDTKKGIETEKEKIRNLVKSGKSYRTIEKETGIGRQTIVRIMKN